MIYKLPFLNDMPEAEFEGSLKKYINMDDTFNSENNCKWEPIDDKIVIFKKGKKIVAIDKDDKCITFYFDKNIDHFEIYQQVKKMVQEFIITPYKLANLK